ncbi:GspH/FimT family pseudopilin [uncultured Lamprocystis sp.]|uniref:GspH/FimT family pseudopilin n=1 Tax=uncultured Lamprocystis sp. TaxID=543132 RepID=UPI0025EC854B|nr:GspH/FimT family pseudopilin [uncultured Lamprocystis sp.]
MNMRRASGFTLVEIMVVLTIAVILLAVAVPSFQSLVRNGRRAALTNEFVLALTFAKSEAVKRGVPVTVCSRATNTTCTTGDGATWDNGWLIFVDNDHDGIVDDADTPPDLVLRAFPALPDGSTLRGGARKRVTFHGTGFSKGFTDTFRLCDPRGTTEGKAIVLSNQGRVRTTSGTTLCP